MSSSSSSRPPTVRAMATTCAPALASANAAARPIPPEAPVTSAMRPPSGKRLTDFGEQRELPYVVAFLAVRQSGGVSAGEAGIAELRGLAVASGFADGAIEPIDG